MSLYVLPALLQVTFLKNGTKSLPKLTSENLKNKQLEEGCLADIYRVLWFSVDPCGYQKLLKAFVPQIF